MEFGLTGKIDVYKGLSNTQDINYSIYTSATSDKNKVVQDPFEIPNNDSDITPWSCFPFLNRQLSVDWQG